MKNGKEALKQRILECFVTLKDEDISVTSVAVSLGVEKYAVSRAMSSMEEEGIINRKNSRNPKLTVLGRKKAEKYCKRVESLTNFFAMQGEIYGNMHDDIEIVAGSLSDEGIKRIIGKRERVLKKSVKDGVLMGYVLEEAIEEGIFEVRCVFYLKTGIRHDFKCYIKSEEGKSRLLIENPFDNKNCEIHHIGNGGFRKICMKKGKFITIPMEEMSFVNFKDQKILIAEHLLDVCGDKHRCIVIMNYL